MDNKTITREQVESIVIQAVSEIQEACGGSTIGISLDTCPIGGLEGFDSLNSVEVVCAISEQVGFEVDARIFIAKSQDEPVSIREVVDRLCKVVEKGGKKKKE